MHYFEDKFAAVGRAMDSAVERMRQRSPKRYRAARVGPSMGERFRDGRERLRDNLRRNRWARWREWDGDQRRRVIRGGAMIAVSLAVGIGVWMYRGSVRRPTLEELMTQAKVQARLEVGSETSSAGPFMGWGNSPRR